MTPYAENSYVLGHFLTYLYLTNSALDKKKLHVFEKYGGKDVSVYLLDKTHQTKPAYNAVYYAKEMLEKQSKNFEYICGYKKPNIKSIEFPEPKLDIFKYTSIPLSNTKIQRKYKESDTISVG